jgi:hypothetical protein
MTSSKRTLAAIGAFIGFGLSAATVSNAQEPSKDRPEVSNTPLIGKLETCTGIADDAERLACFDREVAALVGATNDGAVKVVETEDIKNARKKLFGYSLPDVGIFAKDDKEDEEGSNRLTSTVTKVRKVGAKEWHFWIEEGNAKWRVKSTSMRFRPPKVGDEVEFKPATMGTYWIRLNGRKGARGNRIG